MKKYNIGDTAYINHMPYCNERGLGNIMQNVPIEVLVVQKEKTSDDIKYRVINKDISNETKIDVNISMEDYEDTYGLFETIDALNEYVHNHNEELLNKDIKEIQWLLSKGIVPTDIMKINEFTTLCRLHNYKPEITLVKNN